MVDRREEIADAGIRILATRGARAFTHLSIDRELGLPDGSTSYYARTRRDLVTLVVERLSTRTSADLSAQVAPSEVSVEGLSEFVVAGLNATAARAEDHLARLVLLLECRNDPGLHASLATRPQVRDDFIHVAAGLLGQLGVNDPTPPARDLTALVDALLMQRLVRTAPVNERAIIAAYLAGLLA